MTIRRFIIAGTFCPPAVAERIYGRMAAAIDAEILTLPGLGMGHTRQSADAIVKLLPWEGVDLIGHSQGGLVAFDLATRYQLAVRHCVVIGAPLGGTAWSPTWAPFASARCMARGSRYTTDLHTRWASETWFHGYSEFDCIAGGADKCVIPTSTAHLPGARNHYLPNLSHTELATHPDAIALVRSICDPTFQEAAA